MTSSKYCVPNNNMASSPARRTKPVHLPLPSSRHPWRRERRELLPFWIKSAVANSVLPLAADGVVQRRLGVLAARAARTDRPVSDAREQRADGDADDQPDYRGGNLGRQRRSRRERDDHDQNGGQGDDPAEEGQRPRGPEHEQVQQRRRNERGGHR